MVPPRARLLLVSDVEMGHVHRILALWACAILLLFTHTLCQDMNLQQVYSFQSTDRKQLHIPLFLSFYALSCE